MPKLIYITDKRTPCQKTTTDMVIYNKCKQQNVSNQLDIPSNTDINITMTRYLFGSENIKYKFKLVRFYLNRITFANYDNITMMSDIINTKLGGPALFINVTLECISLVPEIFTVNKSHHIISCLLGLAFNLIPDVELISAVREFVYTNLLGYLERDNLCYQIYGVHKSIINLQPIQINKTMDTNIIQIIKTINHYLVVNPNVPVAIQCDKTVADNVKFNLNDIINDNESEENEFSDHFVELINGSRVKQSSDGSIVPCCSFALKPEDHQPSGTVSFGREDQAKAVKATKTLPQPILPPKYFPVNNKIIIKDIAEFSIPECEAYELEDLLPILNLIPLIRSKAGYRIPMNYDNIQPFNSDLVHMNIFEQLPKPFVDLFKKHPDNLTIAGGYITNFITNTTSIASDIDIFILRTDNDTKTQIMKDIHKCLRQFDTVYHVRAVMRRSVVTIASKFMYNIQFIQSRHETCQDLVNNFDLGCAQSYVTYNKFYYNPDIIHRRLKYNKLRTTDIHNLPLRTIKYLAKGFKLSGTWEEHRENIQHANLLCINESQNIVQSIGKHYTTVDAPSEDEIENQMMNIFGGVYIGNDFSQIKLQEFTNFKNNYSMNDNNFPEFTPSFYHNVITLPNQDLSKMAITINGSFKNKNSKEDIILNAFNQSYYIPINVKTNNIFINKDANGNNVSLTLRLIPEISANEINCLTKMDNYFGSEDYQSAIKNVFNSNNKIKRGHQNNFKHCSILKKQENKLTDQTVQRYYYINRVRLRNNKKKPITILSADGQILELNNDNLHKFDTVQIRICFSYLYVMTTDKCYGLTKGINSDNIYVSNNNYSIDEDTDDNKCRCIDKNHCNC
jgi:hypothetical protein